MGVCLLSHQHGVNIDACETKAAVIQALLASGKAFEGADVRQAPPPVSGLDLVPDAAPPAEGVSQYIRTHVLRVVP